MREEATMILIICLGLSILCVVAASVADAVVELDDGVSTAECGLFDGVE